MNGGHRGRLVFWCAVIVAVAAALAGYYTFESRLPDCGPPQDTFLGQIYWLVPIALLGTQLGVVAWAGVKTRRAPALTIAVMLLATVVTLIGGIAIFLHFFAAGNCGE